MRVYVIEDLEFFKECARTARLKLWRERQTDKGVEIRMRAGSIGFRKEYEKDDPELKKVKEFINLEGFVQIVDVESDDTFFA